MAKVKNGDKSLTHNTKNLKRENKKNPCHPPP
jgi:hypothetical protein